MEKRNSASAEDRALDKFAEMMIEKIKSIQDNWKKPWFTEGALSWPKNLNGREYNGMNALILMMHCEQEGFKMPVFCTFDRVTGLNYTKDKQGRNIPLKDEKGNDLPHIFVKKGSKSIPVFITTFTVVDRESKEKISYDEYKTLNEETRQKYNVYPKLNVYNVFNVDQTNMDEARPDLYQKLLKENSRVKPKKEDGEMFTFDAVDTMINENKWICKITPVHGDDAYYSISKKIIVVPEKEQFKDGESFYSNLFHEMAHSTGAEDQLNRLKPSSFGSKEYAREELIAEMTAALVSQRYGIEKHIKDDSCAYLKNWIESLKEDPSFIKTLLQDIKKASQLINFKIDEIKDVKKEDIIEINKETEEVVLSAMMKQYYDLKKKHPDALLMFRAGDFYETYEDDAENASKILGITLTKSSHSKNRENKAVRMAGFPYHALDSYLPKLIRAGKRVAICDKIEDKK